ncbi:MAG: hypothetical protein EOO04_36395 [Chitinophagaceae bacterium]|nr:MAG: hypothetical protein EOO04_36395 [Chitinophagaceae bacterium]
MKFDYMWAIRYEKFDYMAAIRYEKFDYMAPIRYENFNYMAGHLKHASRREGDRWQILKN